MEFQPTAARQLCASCPREDGAQSKKAYAARTLPEKRADSRRRRGAAYDTRSCGEGTWHFKDSVDGLKSAIRYLSSCAAVAAESES